MSLVRAPRRLPILLSAMAAGMAPAIAGAAVHWTPLGPNGGGVAIVAVAPSAPEVLYAATAGGVFRSPDGGASWTALDRTIGRRDVRAVAIDPRDPDVVYAGTASDNIYKSTDGGATWSFSGNGVGDPYILALAIDPHDPNVILAGTAVPPRPGASGAIFRSTDAGATWRQASLSSPPVDVKDFAIDPADPRTAYAAATYIYKTADGGATWSRLAGSIFVAPADEVLVDPRRPATVVACNAGGAVRSTDAGTTWTALALPAGVPPCPLAFAAGGRLYAAGAVSADDGSSWTPTAPLAAGALSLAADPSSPDTLYAATGGRGVYRTVDGEASWQAASRGLQATLIYSVAVDPANDAVIYAGVQGAGLLRRGPAGSTWRPLLASPPALLAIDPLHPQNLYAGLFRDDLLSGLLGSKDGGATWETVNVAGTGGSCNVIFLLTIDPTSPQTLYAGGECGSGEFGMKSIDGGTTWTPLRGLDSVGTLLVAPRRPSTLYALSSTTVYKSLDAGATWMQASGGLGGRFARALALDPTNPRALYVATDDGLFASTDGAAHWRLVSRALANIQQLFVDAHVPATLYAARVSFASGTEMPDGIFRSADRGRTWTRIDPGVLGERFTVLAVDPVRANTLFVGTDGAGVFQVTIDAPR